MLFQKIKLFLCMALLWSLASCGVTACHAQAQSKGLSPSVQITLSSAPEGKNGKYLVVQVADQAGKPVTDAMVSLEGNMNHGGMAPITSKAVNDAADGKVDGRYQVPFQFDMLGDWIITVAVKTSDGVTSKQDILVQVGAQRVKLGK